VSFTTPTDTTQSRCPEAPRALVDIVMFGVLRHAQSNVRSSFSREVMCVFLVHASPRTRGVTSLPNRFSSQRLPTHSTPLDGPLPRGGVCEAPSLHIPNILGEHQSLRVLSGMSLRCIWCLVTATISEWNILISHMFVEMQVKDIVIGSVWTATSPGQH
jgi:hypothetical protein